MCPIQIVDTGQPGIAPRSGSESRLKFNYGSEILVCNCICNAVCQVLVSGFWRSTPTWKRVQLLELLEELTRLFQLKPVLVAAAVAILFNKILARQMNTINPDKRWRRKSLKFRSTSALCFSDFWRKNGTVL